MKALVPDTEDTEALIADRLAKGLDRFDEKHFGKYVIVNAPGRRHAELVGKLLTWLQKRDLYALVGVNVGDPTNFRIPDVNAWHSAPEGDDFFAGPTAPEIVIEVLSPSNTRADMADREQHYLATGVQVYIEIDLAGAVVYSNDASGIFTQLIDDLRRDW